MVIHGILNSALSSVLIFSAAAEPTQLAYPRHGHAYSTQWWVNRLGMDDVWKISRGAGVVVAVVDSGVEASRPEFEGAVDRGVNLAGSSTDGRVDTDPKSH